MYKIVVIEDDDSVRDNLIKILSTSGYDVSGAGNGKEAVELLLQNKPDLIICDIMLPDINGYKILELINESKKLKGTPFIFLTAKVEMEDLRKGMNLGADDYLTKPFHIKELLEVVKVRIDKSKMRHIPVTSEQESSNSVLDINQRLFLPMDKSAKFVVVGEIKYIISDGSSSYVFIDDESKILVKKLLKDWEKVLPVDNFIRINKTTIINVDKIQKIEKWFNSSYRLFLMNIREPFVISNQYIEKITHRINT